MRPYLLAAALALLLPAAAHAACDDRDALVVDYTKIANRKVDVDKVMPAARALASQGAVVRVRVYDTLRGAKDINALGERAIRECGWTLGDGRRLSNLLFVVFAVEQGDIAVLTGSAMNARVTEAMATKAIATHMVPKWQVYKKDPTALASGLAGMLDAFKVQLAAPLVGPNVNTTIVHTQPTDYSGLWKVLGGIVLIGGLGFFAVLFLRSRDEKGGAQAAQAEASRVRANCIDRLMKLTEDTELLVLEAKIDGARSTLAPAAARALDTAFQELKQYGKEGLKAFSRFDSPDKDDPNRDGLTVSVYHSNQMRYEDVIIRYLEPAEALVAQIDQETRAPGTGAKDKAAA